MLGGPESRPQIPVFDQRAPFAVDRVLRWEGYPFNIAVGVGSLPRTPPLQVPVLPLGISAHDQKAGFRVEILVGHPGRKDEHVAHIHLKRVALGPPSRIRAAPAAMPSTSWAVLW